MKRGLQLLKSKASQLLKAKNINEEIVVDSKDTKVNYFSNECQKWILVNIYKEGTILPRDLWNKYLTDEKKNHIRLFNSYNHFRHKNMKVLKDTGKIEKKRYDMELKKYPGYIVNVEKAFKNVLLLVRPE